MVAQKVEQTLLYNSRSETQVFVYGTLRKGEYNHHWLQDCQLVANVLIRGYIMLDYGNFPYLVPAADPDEWQVQGEIYKVPWNKMGDLDQLEGVDRRFYERKVYQHPQLGSLWVYVLHPDAFRQVYDSKRKMEMFLDGNWKNKQARIDLEDSDVGTFVEAKYLIRGNLARIVNVQKMTPTEKKENNLIVLPARQPPAQPSVPVVVAPPPPPKPLLPGHRITPKQFKDFEWGSLWGVPIPAPAPSEQPQQGV